MAAPNIKSPTSITLKSLGTTVGTSAVTLVTCASDKAVKVSTLYATNVDDSYSAAAKTVTCRINASGVTHAIAMRASINADATLVVVDRDAPVYLEEGQSLEAIAYTTGTIHVVGSYEEIA